MDPPHCFLRGPSYVDFTPTHYTTYRQQEEESAAATSQVTDVGPRVIVELHWHERTHWKTRSIPPSQINDFTFDVERSRYCMRDLRTFTGSHYIAREVIRELLSSLTPAIPLQPEQQHSLENKILSFAYKTAREVSAAGLMELVLVMQVTLYETLIYDEGLALFRGPQAMEAYMQERMLMRCMRREIYDVPKGSEADEENCPICLDKFVPGTSIMHMPCKHGFHGDCILRWLKKSRSCPLCRSEMNHLDNHNGIVLSQFVGAGVAERVIQSIPGFNRSQG